MFQRPNPPRFSAAELSDRIAASLSGGLSSAAQVGLELGPDQAVLHVTRWHYSQCLNSPWTLTLEASGELIDRPDQLLWQNASFWQRDGVLDFHSLVGRIALVVEVDESADLCFYRFTVVSSLGVLDYSRRQRVFQRCKAVEVAQSVLSEHGLYPVELREIPLLARWRQLSQHRDVDSPELFETDLHFVRRILAAEGLSLWLEPDESGERIVIGQAGLGAGAAVRSLPLSTPAGLNASEGSAEHLLDADLRMARAPNIARVWAVNYRDQGRSLRAEFEADPKARPGLGDMPTIFEEPAYGADALIFDGNPTQGVQSWLDGQARLLGQRHHQSRLTLKASSNAAGLWRCGQTVNLSLQALDPEADALWLLTSIEAGSHLGPWLTVEPDDPPIEAGAQPYVHFEASPVQSWVSQGWAPEVLPTAPLNLEQAHVGASPGSSYAGLDPHGRYQVRLNSDDSGASQGATSRPVRHIRSHAGPDYGWHLPLHDVTEVLLAYHGGHPDTPMIARSLHNSSQPDLVTGRNASRNVLRTWANNKFRLEDKQGQEHIKLSTEKHLSQLNLGHIVNDKAQPRGEGFELRTSQWGAIRAAQGLLFTTFAGNPRDSLGDTTSPAHQLHNPASADAQGAQAMAEQRSQANDQVGLGKLEALPASEKLTDLTQTFSAPLIHAASAENLMFLTPASQIFAADIISLAAQGSLELASADQIRLYAKQGITWHTEGAGKATAGKGGSRTDVISHGSDQTQVLKGAAHILAEQDIVLEFRGEKGTLSAKGASLELTQAGVLTITGNTEVISEAPSQLIGGAMDWRAGSAQTLGEGLRAATKVEDKRFANFQLGALPGVAGSRYANRPYKLYRNGVIYQRGLTDSDGFISAVHTDGTSEYKVELPSGQQFLMPSHPDLSGESFKVEERMSLDVWGHRSVEGLTEDIHAGRSLFDFI